jgi:hypothetical protein
MLEHLVFVTGGAFADRATTFLATHDVKVLPRLIHGGVMK